MSKPIPLLKPSSTADRVAIILRQHIISVPEGSYLGSEADLAEEIGVSLPTLRQSARMLEYEQLLTIKPGKGGGYFSRRPSIDTAIKSASQYLSSKDLISNAMFMDCADPIVTKLIEEALHCDDETLTEELRQFVEEQRDRAKEPSTPDDSFKVSARLMTLLGQMSKNLLLELFIRILWNEVSVSRTTGTFEESQQIMKTNYQTRLRLAEAVLEKNREKALKAWQTRSKFLRSWPQRGFHLIRQSRLREMK
jgi:DNA-binding FadR family transcriptional regulator